MVGAAKMVFPEELMKNDGQAKDCFSREEQRFVKSVAFTKIYTQKEDLNGKHVTPTAF